MSSKDLFIFIDESGNFDFTPSGTSHFVLGGVATTSPASSAKEFLTLKYRLLKEGNDVSEFHASEDRQIIRDQVFPVINSMPEINAHVIYGDKHFVG